ncbi:hypothetical protein FJ987_28560 [Mesorhizobium sp. CU2]|nr:hypothetical protein FJ988_30145 [Mesorhizobium sp. CU3]TPO02727.1 hypothetical protein FJ987_28560 [Mesorhizobium sp. CU2]
MRKTVRLLLLATLCGCAATPPPRAPQPDAASQRVDPMPISLALEEIVTAGVRPHLNNPLAARFGSMLAGERTLDGRQEIVVCGSVNDKAGGDKVFSAKVYPDAGNSFELVAIDDGSPNARSRVAGTCRDAGLAVPAADQKA